MDAPILRFCLITLSVFVSTGATFQTPNFTVTAPTADIARKVGKAAETYRRDLAVFWLDQPLPNWSRPCKLRVRPGSLGAGGETKFQFVGGEVLNWDMYVQGSMERILDSVLPHEVNHTIFASHYRRPLPRWADEGAATLFEHRSEQTKQLALLKQVINSDREFIDLGRLLMMKEYPKDYRPMLIMYAEGYALADFLVQQGGRRKYLKFLADGERMGWTPAIKENYYHGGVKSLQKNWKGWVLAGMPKMHQPQGQMLARVERVGDLPRPAILDEYPSSTTVRSQSPEAARLTVTSGSQTRSKNSAGRTASVSMGQSESPVPRTGQPGHSAGSTVFYGLPAGGRSATADEKYRAASLVAPVPRPTDDKPRAATGQSRPLRSVQPANRRSRQQTPIDRRLRAAAPRRLPGYEATGLGRPAADFGSLNQQKHLPQKRKLVTGSTPQWAGFPGQQELF